jgi:hypothetical protein
MSKRVTQGELVALAKSCGEGNFDGVADLVVKGEMPMHKLEDVYVSLGEEMNDNKRFMTARLHSIMSE